MAPPATEEQGGGLLPVQRPVNMIGVGMHRQAVLSRHLPTAAACRGDKLGLAQKCNVVSQAQPLVLRRSCMLAYHSTTAWPTAVLLGSLCQ